MLDELQEIVRECTSDSGLVLTGDMRLLGDLGLNSFELAQVVCEIEDKFGFEIPDRHISGFKTVQNVIDYIASAERP